MQSFSEAFAQYLEEESRPKPHARLPAVKMAEETEQRAKDKVRLNVYLEHLTCISIHENLVEKL